MKSLTTKPGTFAAFCKTGEHRPYASCTPEEIAAAEADGHKSRWDQKQKCEVIAVVCDETFDDPREFERHMLEQHDRKSSRWALSKGQHETWSRSIKAGWPGIRIPAEGKPWKADGVTTRACAGCGLVVEVGARDTTQVIDAHKAECHLREAS